VAGDGGWGFCLRTLGAMAGRQGTEGPGCFSGGCPTGWMVGPRLGTGSKKPPAQENVLGVRRGCWWLTVMAGGHVRATVSGLFVPHLTS
jgi:hypothetical protein